MSGSCPRLARESSTLAQPDCANRGPRRPSLSVESPVARGRRPHGRPVTLRGRSPSLRGKASPSSEDARTLVAGEDMRSHWLLRLPPTVEVITGTPECCSGGAAN